MATVIKSRPADELVDVGSLMHRIQSTDHPKNGSIDAIIVQDDDSAPLYIRSLTDECLEQRLSQSPPPLLRIFLLKNDGTGQSGRCYSKNTIQLLSRKAGISKLLLDQMYPDHSNYVGRFGNGCFVSHNGTVPIFEMIYSHCETEFNHTLVNMRSTGTSTTYFVVNPVPSLYDRLRTQLETFLLTEYPSSAKNLFFLDVTLADEVLKGFAAAASEKWEELSSLDASEPSAKTPQDVLELNLEWKCLERGLAATADVLSFLGQSYARFLDTFGARIPVSPYRRSVMYYRAASSTTTADSTTNSGSASVDGDEEDDNDQHDTASSTDEEEEVETTQVTQEEQQKPTIKSSDSESDAESAIFIDEFGTFADDSIEEGTTSMLTPAASVKSGSIAKMVIKSAGLKRESTLGTVKDSKLRRERDGGGFMPGADDRLRYLESNCRTQRGWLDIGRDSMRVMEATLGRKALSD